MYLAGAFAFVLLFLGDWNDWKWNRRILRLCFPAGTVLLAAVTAVQFGLRAPARLAVRVPFLLLSAVFLGLLVYTLFFAIPAGDAYVTQACGRPACVSGVYALCRHPGVLWFAGLYGCLIPAAGLPAASALGYTALNVMLAAFEDTCVFPARLAGYGAYRRHTPFLVPNPASLRACRIKI